MLLADECRIEAQVMNSDRIGAVGQQGMTGPTLVVGIEQLDPHENSAVIDGLPEVRCVPGHEPLTERLLQCWHAYALARSKTVREEPVRAADKLSVQRKGEFAWTRSRLLSLHNRLVGKNTFEGEIADGPEIHAS
jgi:hypothetical protein